MVATMFREPADVERRVTAGGWVLRGVGVLVVWAAWTFLVGATLLLTGNGGKATGPVVAIVAMLVALLPTWVLVRAARHRAWFLAGATVVLAAIGFFLGSLGGPSLAQMTGVGASLPVATGAQLLTLASVENTLCLQECSQVTHLYAVVDFENAKSQVGTELLTRGWDALGDGSFCQGQFGVRLADVADPAIVDPPAAPPGMDLLSVSTGRCNRT